MGNVMKQRTNPLGADSRPRLPKIKFQADLAPVEDRTVRALKADLHLSSNSDFLSDAVALFQWAVAERKNGRRILSETASGERRVLVFPRLERVAPELELPQVEIQWTDQELKDLAELAGGPAPEPTRELKRAMRL
jgi:hypothetical protein